MNLFAVAMDLMALHAHGKAMLPRVRADLQRALRHKRGIEARAKRLGSLVHVVNVSKLRGQWSSKAARLQAMIEDFEALEKHGYYADSGTWFPNFIK